MLKSETLSVIGLGYVGLPVALAFGKIGRAGLNPIKERQYLRDTVITPDLRQSFEVPKVINSVRPQRIVAIRSMPVERFCGASGAAYEAGAGSGGFLMVFHPLT